MAGANPQLVRDFTPNRLANQCATETLRPGQSTSPQFQAGSVAPPQTGVFGRGILANVHDSQLMSQPVLLRAGVSIAAVRVLQTFFPALIAVAALHVVARAMGIPFGSHLLMLATLSAILVTFTFRPRTDQATPLDFSAAEVIVVALNRWLVTLGLLALVQLITGFATGIPDDLLLTWAILAGVAIVICHLLLVIAERGTVFTRDNERSAVILGVNTVSLALANRLKNRPEYLTQVVGFFDDRSVDRLEPTGHLPVLGGIPDLTEYVKREGIEIIFIALPLRHVRRVMELLDDLRDSTASIYYVPDVFVFDLIQSRSSDIGGVPIVAMCETPFSGYHGVIKRMLDIAFTIPILLVALPVMAIIALAVKATSPGPVIFKQRRYGLDGQDILVYKFRSMFVTEDGHGLKQATKDDARITPVGKFLRRTSLDELPQLFNVIQGTMSLVGPRPHAVAHNEMYRRVIKGYMLRHKVLPGITGLAQINGCRGETAELEQMQARVNYDLDYLRQWTPWLDLRILVRTALQMMRGDKRAY
jgi:putative colanic acid biosynthesis UDP-glucose lipid carrier transferase